MFSPDGSTAYSREKEVYGLFIKYIRQVARGRQPSPTLSSILIFIIGAVEEPVLGFAQQPTITFVKGQVNYQVISHLFKCQSVYYCCTNTKMQGRGVIIPTIIIIGRLLLRAK